MSEFETKKIEYVKERYILEEGRFADIENNIFGIVPVVSALILSITALIISMTVDPLVILISLLPLLILLVHLRILRKAYEASKRRMKDIIKEINIDEYTAGKYKPSFFPELVIAIAFVVWGYIVLTV